MEIDIPWVEKYRPQIFEDIILDKQMKTILERMIQTDNFPHILAYGFPGTGKTTTIINTITKYLSLKGQLNMADVIHLNASDDRGIEVIRTQIHSFVTSKSLYNSKQCNSVKFVILDEVDYMTKNAQQALKYLIQTTYHDIRFILICNYISRIDEGLQNEFLKLHFSGVSAEQIIQFLTKICVKEKLQYSQQDLAYIQSLFIYDIRSMINYMQMNQYQTPQVLTNCIFQSLFKKFHSNDSDIDTFITTHSHKYNMDQKRFILLFLHYLMKEERVLFFSKPLLNFVKTLLHNNVSTNIEFVAFFKKSLLKTLHSLN